MCGQGRAGGDAALGEVTRLAQPCLEAAAEEEEPDQLESPTEKRDVAEDAFHDRREVPNLLSAHTKRGRPQVHPACWARQAG